MTIWRDSVAVMCNAGLTRFSGWRRSCEQARRLNRGLSQKGNSPDRWIWNQRQGTKKGRWWAPESSPDYQGKGCILCELVDNGMQRLLESREGGKRTRKEGERLEEWDLKGPTLIHLNGPIHLGTCWPSESINHVHYFRWCCNTYLVQRGDSSTGFFHVEDYEAMAWSDFERSIVVILSVGSTSIRTAARREELVACLRAVLYRTKRATGSSGFLGRESWSKEEINGDRGVWGPTVSHDERITNQDLVLAKLQRFRVKWLLA